MKVRITQKDIDKGVRFRCSKCPIALAISRRAGVDNVRVYNNEVFIFYYNRIAVYNTSKEAFDFITAFDGGNSVEPVTLELKKLL